VVAAGEVVTFPSLLRRAPDLPARSGL